jgi:hypothetical protein
MYKIKKNVSIPSKKDGTTKTIYPFKSMEIGDSFFIPKKNRNLNSIRSSIQSNFNRYNKSNESNQIKILTRAVQENGVLGLRVWRIQ